MAGMDAAATLEMDRAPQKAGTTYNINKANTSTKREAPGSILASTTGAGIAGVKKRVTLSPESLGSDRQQ